MLGSLCSFKTQEFNNPKSQVKAFSCFFAQHLHSTWALLFLYCKLGSVDDDLVFVPTLTHLLFSNPSTARELP